MRYSECERRVIRRPAWPCYAMVIADPTRFLKNIVWKLRMWDRNSCSALLISG